MLDRAYRIRLVVLLTRMRPTWVCILKAQVPEALIQSGCQAIRWFQGSRPAAHSINRHDYTPIRVIIPFKDQVSANAVKKRLTHLSSKIKTTIQPVFISRKLNEDLKVREVKPATVKQQCVVYKVQCNLCDTWYVGYTRGHLHERVDGHKQKSSSIC